MNYYTEIKKELINNEINRKVKIVANLVNMFIQS